MVEIEHYLAPDGHTNPYLDWLNSLRDNRIKVAVIRRVVLLLCGGDKSTQTADLACAVRYRTDWEQRP